MIPRVSTNRAVCAQPLLRLCTLLCGVFCALPPSCASAERVSESRAADEYSAIAAELREMERVDQELRMRWIGLGAGATLELEKEIEAVDRSNTRRLKQIVAEIGWPGRSQVGAEASHSAWLLVQHADLDPEFQAQALALIEPLAAHGELEPSECALLTDRVLVAQHRPQRYGTQYKIVRREGVTYFGPSTPIEEPAELDLRRARVGLEPIEEYLATLRELFHVPADARPLGSDELDG